jgi:hypothetical protein
MKAETGSGLVAHIAFLGDAGMSQGDLGRNRSPGAAYDPSERPPSARKVALNANDFIISNPH